MPTVELKTNVKIPDVPAYVLELSKIAGDVLKKPQMYMNVIVHHEVAMSFSGTMDPAYQCTIISLGNLTPDANVEYSKVLSEHFEKTLGVSNERGYIAFIDPERTHLGYKGTTFAQIFKK